MVSRVEKPGGSDGVERRGKFGSLGMWGLLAVHLVSAGKVLGVLQNIIYGNNYCFSVKNIF